MDNRKSFKRHKLQGGLLYNSGWCINHHLNDDFTFKETIDLVYRIMRQIVRNHFIDYNFSKPKQYNKSEVKIKMSLTKRIYQIQYK